MTTYLFIDGRHLRKHYQETVQQWFGSDGEIDFGQLKDGFLGGGIARCFYYDALRDEQQQGESQQDFEARLAKEEAVFNGIEDLNGYFVRLGSITGLKRNRRQKKVDILLAVEALDHAVRRNMDRAILLTGDRDFEPLVDSLVRTGIQVHVAGDKKHTSAHLRRAADASTLLTLDDYFSFSARSLQARFPLNVRSTNGVLAPEIAALRSGTFQGQQVTLRRQRFDSGGQLFYMHVEDFYRRGQSLMLESGDVERLQLYFKLRYGEIEWRP